MTSLKTRARSFVTDSAVPLRFVQEARLELHLAGVRMRRRLKAENLPSSGVSLHYGCGSRILPGWLNVDGWHTDGIDLVTDLRQPLPLADHSCDLIFTEHVFEHIDRSFRAKVLQEFARLLKPGTGVLRLVVPDLQLFVDAYQRRDLVWFNAVFGTDLTGRDQLAAGMNSVFVEHFHRFIDDFDSIQASLLGSGFTKVEQSAVNASIEPALRIDTDTPSRTYCSLYIEART